MFNQFAYSAVESVQSGKKQLIDTFIQHDGIKHALNEFVDSQTTYTKAAIDSGISTMTSLGIIFSSQKFYNEVAENFKQFYPQFTSPVKSKNK